MATRKKDKTKSTSPKYDWEGMANGLWEKTKLALGTCKDESERLFRIGKIKWDTTNLQRNRTQLLITLGEQALSMLRNGSLQADSLGPIAQQIEQLEGKIAQQKGHIKEITQSRIDVSQED